MYSDEDLSAAVRAGIFKEDHVQKFRAFVAQGQSQSRSNESMVDEEHFRLVTGFNDFFVVIACFLLLMSVAWLGSSLHIAIGGLAVGVTSWGLAEFFVRKRNMALPAILLLITFIVGIAWFSAALFLKVGSIPSVWSMLAAGVAAVIAARLHWQRFQVPITVAAGVAGFIASLITIATYHFPEASQWLHGLFLVGGFSAFGLAMRWDAQDKARLTRKTDVAFWLHLVAAPLIVHPIFSILGVFSGENSIMVGIVVLLLYLCLALVSIVIDRRALMVSALVYVLFSFSSLLNTFGFVSSGFALTGVLIGSLLLMLSAFWHVSRKTIMQKMPQLIMQWVPAIR